MRIKLGHLFFPLPKQRHGENTLFQMTMSFSSREYPLHYLAASKYTPELSVNKINPIFFTSNKKFLEKTYDFLTLFKKTEGLKYINSSL